MAHHPIGDLWHTLLSREKREHLAEPVLPPSTGRQTQRKRVEARLRLRETLERVAALRADLARDNDDGRQ